MTSRVTRFFLCGFAILILLVPALPGLPAASARAAAGSATPGEHFTQGKAWYGDRAVSVNASTLMAMPPSTGRTDSEEHDLPEKSVLPGENSGPSQAQDISSLLTGNTPRIAQSAGSGWAGTTLNEFGALTGSELFPPDTMGAVGPNEFFVTLNTLYTSYSKAGVKTGFSVDQDTFWNTVRGYQNTTDPRVRYDRLSGRWFVIAITIARPNRIMIAVSNGSTVTPGTTWNFFQFTHSSVTPAADSDCLADYPTLGIDSNALYIGVNDFCGTNETFRNSTGFVVKKSSLLSNGPVAVTAFRGIDAAPTGQNLGGMITPQGVDNVAPNAMEGYFVGLDINYYSYLSMRRVINPGSDTPSISEGISIPVAATRDGIPAPHLGNTGGTNGYLDTVGDRLIAAQLRGTGLWTAQTIGVDSSGNASSSATRDAVRWYQLDISSPASPTVAQYGTIYDGSTSSPRSFFVPSINVTGQGHAAVGYTFAGANDYAGVLFSGRLANDPANQMTQGAVLTKGGGSYNPRNDPGGSGGRRWGDYSYTSVDPCDDMTLWTVQEYANSMNNYGVWVNKLMAPPPPASISFSPASVAPGLAAVSVTVTGAPVNNSAFFDPGQGFACRLAASIPGVVVNSVTYTDHTHVTLSLNTSAAAVGAKTVTITNPDGQATSGSLTVANAGSVTSATALSASPAASAFGQQVTFNATVTGSDAGTPTGTVNFYDGAALLGSGTLNGAGQAAFSTAQLTVGDHAIKATYNGGGAYPASSSAPVSYTVAKANTRLTLSANTLNAKTGAPVTFTVKAASVDNAAVFPTSQQVTIKEGSSVLKTLTLDNQGTATWTTSAFTEGNHDLTAEYAGDAAFNASTSALLRVRVSTVLDLYLPFLNK